MERHEFCERVLAQVRHATAAEKGAIQAELEGHLEDHAQALTEAGCTEDEAAERALAAMGDPAEIGQALNREYPLGWLVLSRVTLTITVLLCLTVLLSFPILGHTINSLQARIAPKSSAFQSEIGAGGVVLRDLDIKVRIGNDVLYIYQVGLDPADGETADVHLAMCNYDRSPLGTASSWLLDQLRFTTSATEKENKLPGGGGGNAGAYYGVVRGIQASRADEFLLVCYDAFGERAEIRVPLPWEDVT